MLPLLLLLACATRTPADAPIPLEARTDVKAPGNLPVRTEGELAAEDAARQACIDQCLHDRQAEAMAIEAIEAQCTERCLQAHPIEQVEVVPELE